MANVEANKGGFDPFETHLIRKESITEGQALAHIIKAVLGAGILSMPIAFFYTGLMMGVICFLITAVIVSHAAYVLAKCAHRIYYLEQKTNLSFGEVSEEVFKRGPQWVQATGPFVRHLTTWVLFLSYFGLLPIYILNIANNTHQVLEYMTGNTYAIRLIIALMWIPCIMLVYIPNLKMLAPISIFANIFLASALIIITYYLLQDLGPISDRVFFRFDRLPPHFSISIFAMICIGLVLPVVNDMREPPKFLGYCGVFVQGSIIVSFACLFIGFLGYWRYGEDTEQAIQLNLPIEERPAQLVELFIALALFGSFGLAFTVAFDIAWDYVRVRFSNETWFCNYVVRTIMVSIAILLAIAVPAIAPFIGLIGAFCFSILGIILPVVFETILDLETGFGRCDWLLWKNIIISVFGIFALVLGTTSALRDIKKLYD